jgi:hypothetical protein
MEHELENSFGRWIHFPYDYHDYEHNGAHSFRIWFNTDKQGRYPIGKKYKLGKQLHKWIENSEVNGKILQGEYQPEEYYTTLRQAFKAGVKWCQQDIVFLIKDNELIRERKEYNG